MRKLFSEKLVCNACLGGRHHNVMEGLLAIDDGQPSRAVPEETHAGASCKEGALDTRRLVEQAMGSDEHNKTKGWRWPGLTRLSL